MKRYIRASFTTDSPDGIPPQRPTTEQLLKDVYALRGEDLYDAVSRADESGNWYREDKRQKRQYLVGLIEGMYQLDPTNAPLGIIEQIEINDELLYIVYGLSRYDQRFKERFGLYNIDVLYNRQYKNTGGVNL